MKSHDLANALVQLARLLRSGPNVEISDLKITPHNLFNENGTSELAFGLSTLAKLTRVNKQQWLSLIKEYELDLHPKPRDASQTILLNLLRYLEKHPEDLEKLKENVTKKASKASPELMKALDQLLRE